MKQTISSRILLLQALLENVETNLEEKSLLNNHILGNIVNLKNQLIFIRIVLGKKTDDTAIKENIFKECNQKLDMIEKYIHDLT